MDDKEARLQAAMNELVRQRDAALAHCANLSGEIASRDLRITELMEQAEKLKAHEP